MSVLDFFFFCGAHVGYPVGIGFNNYFNKFLCSFIKTALLEKDIVPVASIVRTTRLPIFDVARILQMLRNVCSFLYSSGITRLCVQNSLLYDSCLFGYACSTLLRFTESSVIYKKWICGVFTNYYACYFTLIQELYIFHEILYVGRPIYFLTLFFRVLFFSYFQTKLHLQERLYKRTVQRYWQLLVFFRYFKLFYKLPQVFIAAGMVARDASLHEVSILNIPTVGILDSSSVTTSVTYVIPGNSSSFLLVLFYFYTFVHCCAVQRSGYYTHICS